ncbi:MAG: UPF0280 family protein, partial [Gammaproteobacteria bacterium]|nr:UPF0280 family protein [Gammaproteobacteria bacterium]
SEPEVRHRVFSLVSTRFTRVLDTLVSELPLLRAEIPVTSLARSKAVKNPELNQVPRGTVAQRMWRACHPYADRRVTPMAAVAGAVADELLDCARSVVSANKIWINNGGDIALHLANDEVFDCGIVDDVMSGNLAGTVSLKSRDQIGGIATSGRVTSGQGGRSFSLGIADAVTVLAASAAEADVAATLIANEVDLPGHSAITRQSAQSLNPDSDLGLRPVVTSVDTLSADEIASALSKGEYFALQCLHNGLIAGAVLSLRGQRCMIGRASVEASGYPLTERTTSVSGLVEIA